MIGYDGAFSKNYFLLFYIKYMATNIFCFLLFTWHCGVTILLGLECLVVMFPPRARGRD